MMVGYLAILVIAIVAGICYHVVTRIQTNRVINYMKQQTKVELSELEEIRHSLSLNENSK